MELLYPNVDRYLLLKQLLVTVKLAAKNAVLKIQDETYSLAQQQQAVVKTIKEIKEDFTIPYGLLRGGKIFIDLERIEEHMTKMAQGPIPEDAWEYKYVAALCEQDQLFDCIMHYPITEGYMEEHAENLRNHAGYDNGRLMAGRLIEASELCLDVVQHWAEGQPGITMEQCIMMVNGCALTEYIFNLTNDTVGVEDIPDDDIPGC
ncbi:hypothetical protein D5W64_12975 [Salmonella enterica subsp. enterica serovar Saintpaul]|nr:hypothetical protein [Salmonella enterica subsp. enterica serovar Saintpaul]